MKSVCASDRVSSACFFLLLSFRRKHGPVLTAVFTVPFPKKCRNNRTPLYGVPLCTSL